MRLNPKLPFHDRFQSRIAAQAIVYHQFDPKQAIAELRPDIKYYRPFFAKLMDEPQIRHEIEVIMNRGDRNSTKYVKMLWDWLEAENPDGLKDVEENRRTAARLLGKSYLDPRKAPDAPLKPFHVDGQEEGIEALTVVKKLM